MICIKTDEKFDPGCYYKVEEVEVERPSLTLSLRVVEL
jgi:hypothetical protein